MDTSIIPKIKPTIQFHKINGRVYFKSAGEAIEMEDQIGFIGSLCELMDGKKTIDELKQHLGQTYPKEISHLSEAIEALDNAYLLEDDNTNHPIGLTEYDLKRWSRNTEFFASYGKTYENKYVHQARLKTIKVTLLGLGGLGSHILYDLVALGVQNIRAVDFDKVELSNLNRQILYSEKDIGRFKAEAAKDRIYQFIEKANIEFVNKKIDSMQDVENVISDREIVICVADKPKKDMLGWLNAACIKHGVTYINGGVDIKRAVYFSVIPGKTGCAECWKTHVRDTNLLANELLQRETTTEFPDAPEPAIVTFVSVLTGLMLTEFLKLATGISTPQGLGRLMAIDFDAARTIEAETWNIHPQCPVCA